MRADDGASSGAGKKPPVVGSDSSSSGGSDSEEDDKHARAPPDANTPRVPGNKKADLKRLFCFTLSVGYWAVYNPALSSALCIHIQDSAVCVCVCVTSIFET